MIDIYKINEVTKFFKFQKNVLIYMFTNVSSKLIAALAQIYLIYVLTKNFSYEHSSYVMILFGYVIWFQVFEIGLSQTLQNKYNMKEISEKTFFKYFIYHFFFLILISLILYHFNLFNYLLLPRAERTFDYNLLNTFSLGASLLIIISHNIIFQKFLLITNRGIFGNCLLIVQNIIGILGLLVSDYLNLSNILYLILIFLLPHIFINLPYIIIYFFKNVRELIIKSNDLKYLFKDSFSFLLLGVLTTFYLGLDYFFAAHYLSNSEIISYHLNCRIFFISFIIYYSFITYKSKNISKSLLKSKKIDVLEVYKQSIFIGFISVISVFITTIIFYYFGFLKILTNGLNLDMNLVLHALAYFLVRVFRDNLLVILKCLHEIKIMFLSIIFEIILVLTFLKSLAPIFGGKGIFLAFLLASFTNLILMLIFLFKKFYYRSEFKNTHE